MVQGHQSETFTRCPEGRSDVGAFWPKPIRACDYPLRLVTIGEHVILSIHILWACVCIYGMVGIGLHANASRRMNLAKVYAACAYYSQLHFCGAVSSFSCIYFWGINQQMPIMIDVDSSRAATVYWFFGVLYQNIMSNRFLARANVGCTGGELLRMTALFRNMRRLIGVGVAFSACFALLSLYDQRFFAESFFFGFAGTYKL